MRPHSIQHAIKSRIVISLCIAAAIAALGVGLAREALGCFEISPDESAEIKLSLAPGVEAIVQMSLFKAWDETNANAKPTCYAGVKIPLSAFPSTSNRYGPNQVAALIREQVDTWGISECQITLVYENDTEVDFADHELCLQENFSFEKGNFWSSASESYCWEPDPEVS